MFLAKVDTATLAPIENERDWASRRVLVDNLDDSDAAASFGGIFPHEVGDFCCVDSDLYGVGLRQDGLHVRTIVQSHTTLP